MRRHALDNIACVGISRGGRSDLSAPSGGLGSGSPWTGDITIWRTGPSLVCDDDDAQSSTSNQAGGPSFHHPFHQHLPSVHEILSAVLSGLPFPPHRPSPFPFRTILSSARDPALAVPSLFSSLVQTPLHLLPSQNPIAPSTTHLTSSPHHPFPHNGLFSPHGCAQDGLDGRSELRQGRPLAGAAPEVLPCLLW